jgi:hypothetical protein
VLSDAGPSAFGGHVPSQKEPNAGAEARRHGRDDGDGDAGRRRTHFEEELFGRRGAIHPGMRARLCCHLARPFSHARALRVFRAVSCRRR